MSPALAPVPPAPIPGSARAAWPGAPLAPVAPRRPGLDDRPSAERHPAAPSPALAPASRTARALAEGGDARLARDARGRNAYGCTTRPDPAQFAFGSSTASVVSERGFAAARALHARLLQAPSAHAAEFERVRRELAALCGADRRPGTALVLAASGTDILLIARHLAAQAVPAGRAAPPPLVAVMAEPGETGSGVPAALAGRHFAADTALGATVRAGAPAAGDDTPAPPAPVCVPLRRADGTPRPPAEVDADFAAQVEAAVRSGGRALLVLTDVSKTGAIAPSPACARRLAQQHGQALDVLVDACQFRLSAASVAAYLASDFMVALTGSKFYTGPTFCGALLLPPGRAAQARGTPLHALRAYSARAHWPAGWPAAQALPDAPHTGLLLRWQAALAEMAAFAALPPGFAETFLRRWGAAVAARIDADPGLQALPVASLQPHRAHAGWDGLQSIYPFLVADPRDAAAGRPVDRDTLRWLHRALQGLPDDTPGAPPVPPPRARRYQLGQPVACGERQGVPAGALRLCASARGIVEAHARADGIARAIAASEHAFDRVAALMRQRAGSAA